VTVRPPLLDALFLEWVARELSGDHEPSPLSLPNGTSVEVRVEPVSDGAQVVGAVIRLDASPARNAPGTRGGRRRARDDPRFGWASLTDAEHEVAKLVAEGLTNSQTGARLFLSHHTVDSHLRSIYRKLDIRSRVQLTKLVTERAMTPLDAAG
jgi:DNA-binding CsgD family transcriptional regulator